MDGNKRALQAQYPVAGAIAHITKRLLKKRLLQCLHRPLLR
jgi:hypothetical protein